MGLIGAKNNLVLVQATNDNQAKTRLGLKMAGGDFALGASRIVDGLEVK